MVTIEDYKDREQSYVKHVFLESYLERPLTKLPASIRMSSISMDLLDLGKARTRIFRIPPLESL
jgi:hypothetical protein